MKTLKIKWKRLVLEGQTCSRCGSTEEELEKAVSALRRLLSHQRVEVILEKDELSIEEFQKDPLHSNKIWINDVPLEDLIEGKVGKSSCCDICDPFECRTIEIEGKTYEVIPAELIIKAGLSLVVKSNEASKL